MAQRRNDRDNKKGGSAKDRRPIKKKTSILTTESIDWIDYKDVNLLRRFMSERAKIRARIKERATTRRDEVATFLGITPEDLTQQLRSGKSLAEIAGPKTQSLVEMLTNKANTRIDAALAADKIDAEKAATLKTKAAAAIERLVNAKRPVGTARRTG